VVLISLPSLSTNSIYTILTGQNSKFVKKKLAWGGGRGKLIDEWLLITPRVQFTAILWREQFTF
jgi:hypothetical protein